MRIQIITFSLFIILCFPACDTLQQLGSGLSESTTAEIGQGLKQALEFGIKEGATALSQRDGYFKSTYKILLPEEARKVTDKLKFIPGFTDVENVILEKLNRAAEDAAKVALDAGLKKVKVYVKGPGSGRESAIRTIHNAGIEVITIYDITPVPHNGCRPPKRRKV